jgi:YesN/AraC family two-component response regulator
MLRRDEAIQAFGSYGKPIHLLVTDIVMPGMNGKDLAARLLALDGDLPRRASQ